MTCPLAHGSGSSPQQGARTTLYLATAPEVAGVTGRYFVDEREAAPSAAALDEAAARRLWEVSRQLTHLDPVGS